MTSALVLLGYLAGSIPFGVLLTRWLRGVDVRTGGSGNIGATNVTRVAGKKLGAVVLLLDAIKGALPVVLAVRLLPDAPTVHVAVGLAAVLGHIYPVWLKLQGGKGVATALGVLLVLVPQAALAAALVYVAVFAVSRVSSLGSLAAGATAVGTSALTARAVEYAGLSALLFALMLWTHRGNILRLARRTERRF
ncbi:putative membrane protein [Myxococcus xanthus DK 1622]|uniref:Glycerol-3-phosphate acyltransferase n=1 Tax=Myxococcus xanthus (strain DK1622) TaxID=246197 RepID=PLSY_MYXXD|nr:MULTISPECIES: glycerol-3-phosphate 1-O-acyltransferase PlsY [Myxococcus]Q1DCA9.1 RecName: Full=Glycerol-3-phosphate acyltransferase; AltName: Full=Acyl-PO4 G3P acyltransferase; AltName: Full=Acyl-phosphate--glycerol-3-phosphate acyltransferase; AltName: Full=G3P acyltransferase; Short=GPAT; AltName: Full=Lysophosphatidic acid synthase; Short=LPA synthase [Myxococcus xanthus DK 1622]ABF89362.1 putative membrane protein [Myxococcus xanthus DK 1622]NOJ55809.1 glycerol-3-phosphate acyltransferase